MKYLIKTFDYYISCFQQKSAKLTKDKEKAQVFTDYNLAVDIASKFNGEIEYIRE